MNKPLLSSLLVLGLAVGLSFNVVAEEKAKPAAAAKGASDKPTSKAAARPQVSSPIPPTQANVPYGTHPKQVLDFYQAKSETPTPVVFHIHGGGWQAGSKDRIDPTTFLKEGISVVSVEYRFIAEATADGVKPPVKGPLHDAARALQFVRSKAQEWNLNKSKIAATGGSAGACSSLWLAFHDDLADPKSDDPIARESTRLLCAAVSGAQTSLDPKQLREWMPNAVYGAHAFGIVAGKQKTFDAFLAQREEIMPWIKEYSPYELVSKDDPPVGLYYGAAPQMGKDTSDPTHSANYGVGLLEKCKAEGVDCELVHAGAKNIKHISPPAYLIAKLKGEK